MRVVTIILIVVALAVAGATAFLVSQFLAETEEASQVPVEVIEEPKVEVLVTTTDLPMGKILQSEDYTWQLWPEDSVLADHIMRQNGGEDGDMEVESAIRGSAVRIEMVAGEPIISSKIFQRGDSGFLSGVLSPGMRAVTIGVNPETSGGGFVLPGDRVDLVVIFDILDENEVTGELTQRVVSETVLQDIRVLAVDQQVATDSRGGGSNETLTEIAETVTLEVTPNEAQIVAVADQMGKLRLVLRAAIEGEISEIPVRYSPDYVVSQFLARRVPESARVLVARHDIETGTVLTDRDWTWVDFPAEEIDPTWLREGSLDVNDLRSALTDVAFEAGQPLIADRLIMPGQDTYITSILDPGMRAITLSLNEEYAVSAFIRPGDFVDVLYRIELDIEYADGTGPLLEKSPRNFGETLIENIRVLHLDREFAGEDVLPEMSSGLPTVTLEVTPAQAELLVVARGEGELSLVLRGDDPGDESRLAEYQMDFDTSRASVDLFYGLALPDPPQSLLDLYAHPAADDDASDDGASVDPNADLLDLEDYLTDLGSNSNAGTGSNSDTSSGRGDGELRVYRATQPQDFDFSSD
ncbi:MAG: Flp pilus assembly protein CpaB [Alphaproteobacteria bacterium]|jgi:pilus assembly protein CpaB|nr:Flp pilus assembly protein CpaB [Rhodospirillaceae bacterium]MBT6511752.1 Flp pilus assembly protein CpaB [Rhodospirillaceae bacterium]MBT7648851.1 Flp pilus assembly protein CpaB [Rhodospirillaceae bacterium]MDG2482561.1 Flp pilus assembly protein CpaB [Alphaproteobacteria bacterium]